MLDFVCIGAQKAGTSYLHKMLDRSPEIYFPKGKEVHYWDWVQLGKSSDNLQWYQQVFSERSGLIQGDMTPDYSILQIKYIEQFTKAYPHLKVLFVMRNPIERAWSALRMFMAYCQFNDQPPSLLWQREVLTSSGVTARSDYMTVLLRWRQFISDDRFMLLIYDDLKKNPRLFLQRVLRFIGASSEYLHTLPEGFINAPVRLGRSIEPEREIQALLHQQYDSEIDRLSKYLNQDLSYWKNIGWGL